MNQRELHQIYDRNPKLFDELYAKYGDDIFQILSDTHNILHLKTGVKEVGHNQYLSEHSTVYHLTKYGFRQSGMVSVPKEDFKRVERMKNRYVTGWTIAGLIAFAEIVIGFLAFT